MILAEMVLVAGFQMPALDLVTLWMHFLVADNNVDLAQEIDLVKMHL
jgi:hypothetical protein